MSVVRQLIADTLVLPVRRGITMSTHCTTLVWSQLFLRRIEMELASNTLLR